MGFSYFLPKHSLRWVDNFRPIFLYIEAEIAHHIL